MIKTNPSVCETTFLALGTFNSIKLFDKNDTTLLSAAVEKVLELEEKMSAFKETSEISRFNRNAGKGYVRVSKDTYFILKRATEIAKASLGAFDITMHPLISLWQAGKKGDFIPENEEIHEKLDLVNYKDILFDETTRSVALKRVGQSVDLGGIAKGYAADEGKKILISNHVKSAVINLGGNIVTVGSRPDGSPWRIGIQNPFLKRGEFIGHLDVSNQTVVTSGSYERFFVKNGIRYHHILDPKTGHPTQSNLLSVTAVCDSSVDADALTTAFFVLGPEKGTQLLQNYGAEAVFVTEDNKVFATGTLTKKLTLI